MKRKKLTFRLPEDLIEQIESRALATDRDRTAVVIELLRLGLGSDEGEPLLAEFEILSQKIEQIDHKLDELAQNPTGLAQTAQLSSPESASNQALTSTNFSLSEQILNTPTISFVAQQAQPLAVSESELGNSSAGHEIEETRQSVLAAMIGQQSKVFDQVLSAYPDPICVLDRLGRFTYVNYAIALLFQSEQHHMLGKTWQELGLPPALMKPLDTKRERVFMNRRNSTLEINHTSDQGSYQYEYTLSPILDINNGVEAIICIARDITERHQVQTALRESEAKYRNLFESAHDSVFIIDAETQQFLNANWNAARRLGYTHGELLSLSAIDIETEAAAKSNSEIIKKLEAKGSIVYESRYRRKNGTEMPVEISSRVIEYEGRLAIQSFVRDISKRQEAEEKLRLLQLAVFHANDAIVITEAELLEPLGPQIVYVNSGFTKMTGYQSEEIIGKTPRILQGEKTNRTQIRRIKQALSKWQPVKAELINYRQDGSEFWVSLNIVPFANQQGRYTHFVAVQREVTEQKQRELELQQSEEMFRTSVENMLDCLGIYSAVRDKSNQIVDFTVEYLNPAACFSNSLTKEEQIGCSVGQLLPTELFEQFCLVVETGKPLIGTSLVGENTDRNQLLGHSSEFRVAKLGDGFVATWRDAANWQ
ncbi:MAG: PAS domain S-box protein [Symploca sp. SIO2E9]|nr:PAS domain S-box protein [Symploca sp. SIO2E9]